MNKTMEVARCIVCVYEKQTQTKFENSELKLQKLMYLAQRESLCLRGKTLFDTEFEGWRHGPVIPELRFYFENNYEPLENIEESTLTSDEIYVINNVIAQYGMYEAWYLADLTHRDISWKNARRGLNVEAPGCNHLKIEDIRKDAENVRPYDYVFDMYLDEFEDADEEELHV